MARGPAEGEREAQGQDAIMMRVRRGAEVLVGVRSRRCGGPAGGERCGCIARGHTERRERQSTGQGTLMVRVRRGVAVAGLREAKAWSESKA